MLWELREGAYVTAFPSPASRGQSDSFRLIPLGSPTLLPPAVNFHTDFHEFTLDLKQELAVLVAVDTGRCGSFYSSHSNVTHQYL